MFESYRIEMKKFGEAKQPLTMLKFRMKIMADKKEGYKLFLSELETMCEEQQNFLNTVEYEVAVADSIDPVQAIIFFLECTI